MNTYQLIRYRIQERYYALKAALRRIMAGADAVITSRRYSATVRELEHSLQQSYESYKALRVKYDALSREEYRLSQILTGLRKHYQDKRRAPASVRRMLDL